MMGEVMSFQGIAETTHDSRDGAKGCFRDALCPRSDFSLDSRPVFRWPQAEAARKEQDIRRRSIGRDPGENGFWAVATPF